MISIRRRKKGSPPLRGKDTGRGGSTGTSLSGGRKSFLNFSRKTDYGLFLLSTLAAQNDGPVSLKNVCLENGLSFYFMQRVALDLRRAGIIGAARGKTGGYEMTKDPARLKLPEILEALEGPLAVMHCLRHGDNTEKCSREDDCSIKGGLGMLNEIIIGVLSEITFKNFINSKWKRPRRRPKADL